MSFPRRPGTADERRTEFLRLMEVPGRPRLFVLGSFASYVTVYAQQVRAFNLIDALAKSGYLSARSEVAVVGGGIAGMTAAAAAAVRGVARVAVFEKRGDTMRLQRGSEKRFLHPHIYDWPAEQALEDRAGHGILDWSAASAADVVHQLAGQWKSLQEMKKYRSHLETPHVGCENIEIEPGGQRWSIRVPDHPAESFDVVVLAVGFGLDSTELTEGYWTDTSLDGLEVESRNTWFVSGNGDGGLTDLMRLCIMDFRHQAVLEAVDKATRNAVGNQLLEAEQVRPAPDELAKIYLDAAGKIKAPLDRTLRKRNLGEVRLNCATPGAVFSGRSSILNRLIVAYLYADKRFVLFAGGKIELPQKTPNGKRFRITFQSGREPLEVDHVILRHGPQSELESGFHGIWKDCRRLEARWKAALQHEDWTCEPLYSPEDFAPEKDHQLRVDFGKSIGCVAISSSKPLAGLSQEQRVKGALMRFKKRLDQGCFAGREVENRPVSISVPDALSTSAAWERTVRALCVSDIAIFDITGFESAVMLLLGVRAAVRRGITLTVTQDSSAGLNLPFNLAALNPIQLGPQDTEAIANAIEAGLNTLRAQPEAYLDLPAFDAIRRLGEDPRPQTPAEQTLVLRWFDEQYGDLVRDLIENAVLDSTDENSTVVTTLDSRSPQLVSQRLYAAIRRTQLCIADWTGWRPNVFFEIGVRLAVNRIDPVHILCKDRPPGWDEERSRWPGQLDPTADALRGFFAPTEFTFEEHTDICDRIRESLQPGGRWTPGAMLSPGRTYQVICESIPRELEPGGQAVDTILLDEATRMAGPAEAEEGAFPLLYSDVLAAQARRSSVEMLLAAWHYLDRRHALGGKRGLIESIRHQEILRADPSLGPLREVGQQLSSRLRNVPGKEYETIAQEVREVLAEVDPHAEEMADLIERARRLKAEAMDARDKKEWDRAIHLLKQTSETLLATRDSLQAKRDSNERPGWLEKAVANQLIHILGTMGGVLRRRGRQGDYAAAAKAYDQGYKIERPESGYDIVNSYNMIQRLVARVFLEPRAVIEEAAQVEGLDVRHELTKARGEIEKQRAGKRRDDEYAAADLAMVQLLLGDPDWIWYFEEFLASNPEPYAISVTLDLLEALHTHVNSPSGPRELAERLSEASAQLRVALSALDPAD